MKILVTGASGFIGFHLSSKLLQSGNEIFALDNISDYYDVELKYARLFNLGFNRCDVCINNSVDSFKYNNIHFVQMNIEDRLSILDFFKREKFDFVCHLAAQAGVRYSIINPYTYIDSNISGFINILEACRQVKVKHLVYASSSSVYGLNSKVPFSEKDSAVHPVSLYAASKKSNELMAHVYSYLYGLPTTGLRFFTVYGPWGRPDMSPFIFMDAILRGHTINIYNNGDMIRDFTYIDDIVEAITRAIDHVPSCNLNWNSESPDPGSSSAPYKIYNVGNSKPVKLMDFIYTIEKTIGKEANKVFLPMQPGDVYQTNSDTCKLQNDFSFKPNKTLEQGVTETVRWFREFYKLLKRVKSFLFYRYMVFCWLLLDIHRKMIICRIL